ncbi:hypothetical protein JCM3770_006022 [Rhodotorula araucariae]
MQGFQRGHQKQASSFGAGSAWSLPPLSLPNTLALHAGFAAQGATDAMKLTIAGQHLTTDKVVQANVLKSSVCQGIVLVSALVIKPILRRLVGLRPTDSITSSVVFLGFHILFLYPLAAAATYYSGLLRPAAETDRRRTSSAKDNRGMAVKLVSESYRALVTVNYFVFFYALRLIPFLGAPLSFLYASIVDAYYCFEAHWVKNGWPFGDRVRQIEQRWAYAFGFGLPITIMSWWSSDPVVNLAIFALLYPLFSLTSTSAIPQPLDPSLPGAASSAPAFLHGASGLGHGSFSIAAAEGGEENRGRKGSALVPVRIRALVLAEFVYSTLTAAFGAGGAPGAGGRKKDAGGGAGMGHGHGASPARMAMAQRVNAFDPHYGAPSPTQSQGQGQGQGQGGDMAGASAYAGSAYGGGSAYGSPVRARGAEARYSMESDPYGTGAGGAPPAQAPYAGGGQATPPRRGYQSEYASPVAATSTGGAGAYGGAYNPPPPPPPQPQLQPQGGGGYGGDRALDAFIRQAGMRGKNKGD